MTKREEVKDMDREMWEAAKALQELGYWVKVESHLGRLTVYRDGVEIGRLSFPVEDGYMPPLE